MNGFLSKEILEERGYYAIYLPDNPIALVKALVHTIDLLSTYGVIPEVLLVTPDDYDKLLNASRFMDRTDLIRGMVFNMSILVREPDLESVGYALWKRETDRKLDMRQWTSRQKDSLSKGKSRTSYVLV